MSIRNLFAANLRRLSSTRKSHAQVARELGLNRQQFNGYITGKNLPNERVIDNICAFFQVDVSSLFREADPDSDLRSLGGLTDRQKIFVARFVENERSTKRQGLADGLYYIYFSVPDDRFLVACSLLAVRREGGVTTFRRVTRVGGSSGLYRPNTKAIHSGIILHRDQLALFVGLDKSDGGTPSLLVARPVTSPDILYSGQAHVATSSAFEITNFYITPIKKRTGLWSALRGVRMFSTDELYQISKALYEKFI